MENQAEIVEIKKGRSSFYEDKSNITIYLPKGIKRSFKALMRDRDLSISESIRNFIVATLEAVNK